MPHQKTIFVGDSGGEGESYGRIQGEEYLPFHCLQRKNLETCGGHLEHLEVWSPGLFNVSSNELDDETARSLIS